MRITFVTGNEGKAREMAELLAPTGHTVVQDKRGYPEIQAATLAEVSDAGAAHLRAAGLQQPFLIEDSGLFISALRGFPGAYSRNALDTIGVAGILRLMDHVEAEMRTAAFETDLLFVDPDGKSHHLQGFAKGTIAAQAAGTGGFGFDSIFIPASQPAGQQRTFAQMESAEKSALSHRGEAARRLVKLLDKTAKA